MPNFLESESGLWKVFALVSALLLAACGGSDGGSNGIETAPSYTELLDASGALVAEVSDAPLRVAPTSGRAMFDGIAKVSVIEDQVTYLGEISLDANFGDGLISGEAARFLGPGSDNDAAGQEIAGQLAFGASSSSADTYLFSVAGNLDGNVVSGSGEVYFSGQAHEYIFGSGLLDVGSTKSGVITFDTSRNSD